MRRLLVGLACALWMTLSQAQITGAMFLPTPLGVILSIGQWIGFETNKVYYIEVAGDGATTEQARQNGFRLAVEQAIGSLVSSEAEVQNGRLIRDEIINYSAGYVDRFDIVKTEPTSRGSRVTMKVWVKRSALANRLLNESKQSAEVDGATASVSFQTAVYERQSGDRLLASVLKDFPQRAFEIQIGKSRVTFTGNRQAKLEIPIVVEFSKHYLDSLWAALEATQNTNGGTTEITLKSAGMFGVGGTVGYTDDVKFRMLRQTLVDTKPMIKVTLLTAQNQVVASFLHNMVSLTHDGAFQGVPVFVDVGWRRPSFLTQGPASNAPYQMLIDGRRAIATTIGVDIDPLALAQITQIKAEIVR